MDVIRPGVRVPFSRHRAVPAATPADSDHLNPSGAAPGRKTGFPRINYTSSEKYSSRSTFSTKQKKTYCKLFDCSLSTEPRKVKHDFIIKNNDLSFFKVFCSTVNAFLHPRKPILKTCFNSSSRSLFVSFLKASTSSSADVKCKPLNLSFNRKKRKYEV